MAYENLKLVNASISGDIYLTRMLKGGTMSDNRRIITDECLKATASWFLSNDRKVEYELLAEFAAWGLSEVAK
ncbi:hypothetical protein K5L52_000602 [Listeria monocytogenes]|nr:hypothetical protein [Listeria monocytogenes]EAC8616661.1 hypothetical protein [Listeria monocytogenes]EAC9739628.1 hypothetical protein [Listeria monocytogenes]EAC9745931.1 hypothetical protein [Listeria monocytogenes]EAE9317030.1 hypothetical protein [Listeria monocytogenes]